MNQILSTKLDKNKKTIIGIAHFSYKKQNWFKFQFTISIFTIIILISCCFFYFYNLRKEENFSNNLIANYNIYKLYSVSKNTSNQKLSNGLFRNY